MWICLNNAFLSIVAHRTNPDLLLVRARLPGHIEAVFPDATVFEPTGRADYQFRSEIPRKVVAELLAYEATRIQYTNFKDSVQDDALHHAYMGFWTIMYRVQSTFLAWRQRQKLQDDAKSGKPLLKENRAKKRTFVKT